MRIRNWIGRTFAFWRDRRGIMDTQMAFLVAGVSLAVAVLAAPVLQGAVAGYAQNRALGIDRVMTGSVSDGKRVTVRRSVLSENPTVICASGSRQSCPSR